MSVDNPNVIDFISEQDDDKVVLTISDHLEWDDEDNNHLYLLQEKVNAYLFCNRVGSSRQSISIGHW